MSASLSPGNFGQDENEWFGGRDQDAEEAASKSLAATAARIVGAKPFPVAAKRLEELTRTTSARIEQVVVVLESDPALSARLLRLVNSAGYGLKVRCTSVRHAAVLVGTRRLNQVATTAAILDLFESSNSLAAELLEHAAVVGSLCRYLAVHLGLPHDELFTCGFLHDIGKIMLLDTEREVYPALLREFGGNPDSVHEQERRVFGFDHATLGAHVLTAWNIPEPVPKVIAWHHQPARALQDSLLSAMVQTLRLADLLAYELGRRQEQEGIQLVAASEAAQYLDISEPQLAAMWHDLAALRDRSKARSHGEAELEAADPRLEVPQSLRPRGGSLSPRAKTSIAPTRGSIVPTDSDPPGSIRPGSEQATADVPKKLSCVVCGTGSYGNVCQACGGHVCPNHQSSADEWCSLCEDEFIEFKTGYRLPPSLLTAVGSVVVLSLFGSVASAWSSGNTGFSALLAPLLMTVVWALVLPIGLKLWIKLRFMRDLTPRTPPRATSDTTGQELKEDGQEQLKVNGQVDLPPMASVIPDYDRSTLHGSVAPPVDMPVEPFAAGLVGMLPPAETRIAISEPPRPVISEPPPSSRGPMVIRVDVPSMSPMGVSVSPSAPSQATDGQLSAMARLVGPSVVPQREARDEDQDDEPQDSSGHISSVMPAAISKTPASMVPSSEGPEIHVGVLSMPHLRSERPVAAPESPVPTPAPILIAPSAPPAAPAPPASAVEVIQTSALPSVEEGSGVRHVLLRNEPGLLREACSPLVLNRCS
ncbi:MAG TPA: HDOD domain-containing protein [Polyangiaceae bacterium]|nr:HDOD domain-containing protein [Polyangiaceae bacterium]